MSLPPPKHSSGRRVFWLCFISICMVVGYLVYAAFSRPSAAEKKVPDEIWRALRPSARVILYSIDPMQQDMPDDVPGSGNNSQTLVKKVTFHNYGVLGSIELDGRQASAAAGAFQTVLSHLVPPSLQMMCFNPRHGLRVESGGHEYDFLLCYECRRIVVFCDGSEIYCSGVTGSPQVLNALLTDAKIPLAKTD